MKNKRNSKNIIVLSYDGASKLCLKNKIKLQHKYSHSLSVSIHCINQGCLFDFNLGSYMKKLELKQTVVFYNVQSQ